MTHSSAVHSRSVHFFGLNAFILAQVDECMEVNYNPGYINPNTNTHLNQVRHVL